MGLESLILEKINCKYEEIEQLFNRGRGARYFQSMEVLRYLIKGNLINIEKYSIRDEFYKFHEKIQDTNLDLREFKEYSREPEIYLEQIKILYEYLKLNNENIRKMQNFIAPMHTGANGMLIIEAIAKIYIPNRCLIIDSNSELENFIILTMFKELEFYIFDSDCIDHYIYKIIRTRNYLGALEEFLEDVKKKERVRAREIINMYPIKFN